MAYRLSLSHEDLADDSRRCAREQLDDAATQLRGDGETDREAAIHEARKDLKKVRALLRLVRPALGDGPYGRENARLRDVARALSRARDADVLVDTADALAERHAGQLPAAAFDALSARLRSHAARVRAGAGPASDDVLARLDGAVAGVGDWPLEGCDADALRAGALRAYRRGRRAMARAERDPSTEQLHEWRKRVKDLWYHARLLQEAWPRMLKAQAKEAHALADMLGDDHDLAALAAELDPGGAAAGAPIDADALRELIAGDRTAFQERARRLGHRLYAERPKAFDQRLTGWLGRARTEAHGGPRRR
jgi:CHAD domain-containing protein